MKHSAMKLLVCAAVTASCLTAVRAEETVDMYRLYNTVTGEHLYTDKVTERDYLIRLKIWKYEGVAWTVPKESSTGVHRMYNPNAGDHHYTSDEEEIEALVGYGWKDEGVLFYSSDSKEVAILRQYNKNAVAGAHNFTTSNDEQDYLVKAGWKSEEVNFYALREGDPDSDSGIAFTRHDASGNLITGWVTEDSTGNEYYYDADGNLVRGEYVIDGITYSFDEKTGVCLGIVEAEESGEEA